MATSDCTPLKRCSKCKQEKPATLEYFRAHKQVKCGLRPSCVECDRAFDRERNATPKRKEHFRDREKKPERQLYRNEYNQRDYVKEKSRQSAKFRWHNDPEYRAMQKSSDVKRRKSTQSQDYHRNYLRDWHKTPMGRLHNKVSLSRRRSLILNAEGSYTTADIKSIYAEQEGRCAYCGITVYDSYHIDHIKPLSKGGSNWPNNLAIACKSCNQSKNNKTLDYWMQTRGW